MGATKIEYLTHTWNPLAMRCDPVSEACDHCWHLAMAKRLTANPNISLPERNAFAGKGIVRRANLADMIPKKPARIGVQFMGDLFHEAVPDEMIEDVKDAMIDASFCGHIFMILTKRPERMRKFFTECLLIRPWLWLGVTAENQARADERIPVLLQIPAAKRFVSIEPILSPVDLERYIYAPTVCRDCGSSDAWYDPNPHNLPVIKRCSLTGSDLTGEPGAPKCQRCQSLNVSELDPLSWVIIGQETGPGARPAKAEWFLDIISQCKAAGVLVFVKKAPEGVPIIRELPK